MELVDAVHLAQHVMSTKTDIVSTQLALLTAIPMQHLSVLVLKTAIALQRLTLATQLTHHICVHVVQIGQIILYVT